MAARSSVPRAPEKAAPVMDLTLRGAHRDPGAWSCASPSCSPCHAGRRDSVGWRCGLWPSRVAVSDFRSLAGTYTGTMNEASELNRSVRLVLEPSGSFELAVGDPKG